MTSSSSSPIAFQELRFCRWIAGDVEDEEEAESAARHRVRGILGLGVATWPCFCGSQAGPGWVNLPRLMFMWSTWSWERWKSATWTALGPEAASSPARNRELHGATLHQNPIKMDPTFETIGTTWYRYLVDSDVPSVFTELGDYSQFEPHLPTGSLHV